MIGHDYGPVGDVAEGRKITDLCISQGVGCYLLDLFADLAPGISAEAFHKNLTEHIL